MTVALVSMAVSGGIAGALVVQRGAHSAPTDCHQLRALRVSAAPEIAPAVALLAQRTTQSGCHRIHVEVTAAEPADVAGILRAGSVVNRPDVWIPDSSVWVAQLPGTVVAADPARRSIARSPIVLALPAQVAQTLGTPPSFRRLAAAATTAHPILLGARGFARSASALGALVSLYATSAGDAAELGNLAALLRTTTLAPVTASTHLPAHPVAADGSPVAVPTSEQAVWAADHAAGAQPFTAVYPPAPGPTLDYPYVVLSHTADAKASAGTLLAALDSSAGRAALAARGFRSPSGIAGSQLASQPGVDGQAPATAGAPSPSQVADVVKAFATVNKPSRMLAVIDVSGSMSSTVPGNSGSTRIDVARAAAAEGLGLLPDASAAGLWRFSADLTPTTDYQQLVPLAPLNPATRAQLADAVMQLQAVPGGGTGLYDTIRAAVRSVRAHYDPTRVNSVVVLTDGKDEADANHGIALSTLLAALKVERASTRPVKVIAIAYGPDSDAATLRLISAASGGISYLSTDPRDLPKIFRDAIGQRLSHSRTP